MISDIDALVEGFVSKFGKNSSNLSEDLQVAACNTAISELGWVFPLTHHLKEFWAVNRAVRHGLAILQIESAHKFRYKEIFLQNRFSHYTQLIDKMDRDFETAKEENPTLFLESTYIDTATLSTALSYYIRNERDYDDLGRPLEQE